MDYRVVNKKIMPLSYLFIILFSISLSTNSWALYSDVYDRELNKLVQINPEKALKIASKRLKSAYSDDDKLVAIFYLADSYNMLNQFSQYKDLLEKGLTLAKKLNNSLFIFEFTRFRVFQYEMDGEYLKALNLANENHQMALKLEDDRLIAISLRVRGKMHLNIDDNQSALSDLEKSIEIFKKHHDKTNLSNSYNTLAIIYEYFGDYENSIKFYKESLVADDNSNYDNATVYYNIGASYLELHNYDTALEYFEKTINSAKKVKDLYTINFAKSGIADTYLEQGKYDKAKVLYLSTLKDFEKDNDVQMLFNINLSLVKASIMANDFEQAQYYMSQAELYSATLDSTLSKNNILIRKVQLFKAQKKWMEAFNALVKQHELENELNAINKDKIIEELKVKFNAQFDQKKMMLLEQKNNLQQDLIYQHKTRTKYLQVIVALVGFLLLGTFYAFLVQKRQRKHLYKLSTTDSLTQAYNRRYIVDYLKEMHSKRNVDGFSYSVIMIDLDFFKSINDTYGHEMGNKILIVFTNIVKKHVTNIGKIGRIGGEEWLIVLSKLGKKEIEYLLSQIRKEYNTQKPDSLPSDSHLNFSSGILLKCEHFQDYDKILNEVDKALYKAKTNGRGQDFFISSKKSNE